MTRFTPLWQQAGSYPAQYDRGLLDALWPTAVAVGSPPVAVSNTMNVSIPAGWISVPLQSGQYTALCRWDAPEVVTSPPAPASGNFRVDYVICQVRDPTLDAGVNNDFIFLVLSGVEAPSNPQPPTVPPNATLLSWYTVPGGVANLNGVALTDYRAPATSLSALSVSAWTSPPLNAGWIQQVNYQTIGWRMEGKTVVMRGTINRSGAGVSGTSVVWTLPVGARPLAGAILFAAPTNQFLSSGQYIFVRLNIGTNGDVVVQTGGAGWTLPTGAAVTFDAVRFPIN